MAAPFAGKTNFDSDSSADQYNCLFDEWSDDDAEVKLAEVQDVNGAERDDAANGLSMQTGKNCIDNTSQLNGGSARHENGPTADQDIGSLTDHRTPLEKYRPGYLWVSDITRQHWCEQQMLYTFTLPTVVEETPVMVQGTDLHLARELACHNVVNVKVTSSEDIWAIKVLNLNTAVQAFLNGAKIAREVPIFGFPLDQDVFMVGLIDELRFDLDLYTIDLSDLKTRQSKSLPSRAQANQHALQVMLYKVLFDDLVKGKISKQKLCERLRIDLQKELGEDIKSHMSTQALSAKNLDELMDCVFMRMQMLTCVNQLFIEYVHQDSKETLLQKEVTFCEDELLRSFGHYMRFWRGQREVEGVDIEEAWKCQRCDFNAVCEWREKKSQEYANRNKRKNKLS